MDTEYQGKIRIEKRLLGEPITPYCTDAYNTLISVVQGLAVGAFALIDFRKYETDGYFLTNTIVAFLVICVIWHRYCVENQYIAWTLGLPDTIIPMLFGLLEVNMVFSISGPPDALCSSYVLLFLWGAFAYYNSIARHDNPRARQIYIVHFSELGPDFGSNFLDSFLSFTRRSRLGMAVCAAFSSFFFFTMHTGLWAWVGLSLAFAKVVLSIFAVVSSGCFFYFNLRRHLNSDKKIRTILGW